MRLLLLSISIACFFSNSYCQDNYFKQLFYVDFQPTEKESSFFEELNDSILRVRKNYRFVYKKYFLTGSELDGKLENLKDSSKKRGDTVTSYRIYFSVFNGFKNFGIFGFGKNYSKYTFVHGYDTTIKVGIEPPYYLRLIDYKSIISTKTNAILRKTLLECFKRNFSEKIRDDSSNRLTPFITSRIDSNTMDLLEGYFQTIVNSNYRKSYDSNFYLFPFKSSQKATEEQIDSVTNVTHKKILTDEEYGEIETSFNSPILPSEVQFSLTLKESAIPRDYEDYYNLWITLEPDFVGFTYVKGEGKTTLWQTHEAIISQSDNKVLTDIIGSYYYYSIWNRIKEKPIDVSKRISEMMKNKKSNSKQDSK